VDLICNTGIDVLEHKRKPSLQLGNK